MFRVKRKQKLTKRLSRPPTMLTPRPDLPLLISMRVSCPGNIGHVSGLASGSAYAASEAEETAVAAAGWEERGSVCVDKEADEEVDESTAGVRRCWGLSAKNEPPLFLSEQASSFNSDAWCELLVSRRVGADSLLACLTSSDWIDLLELRNILFPARFSGTRFS